MHATIWFDGASRGNPGPMAGGAVVEIDGERVVLRGRPGRGTNNEAEYDGLILGLKYALEEHVSTTTIKGDSQLVLRQLEGRYKVRAPNLLERYQEARALVRRFDQVAFEWVRRADNSAADQAANEALDGPI